uniref:Uncharacterized protein n=1 Tax=Arion vulgaris TaxID=1028688 RepID=A0A0B7BD11_9EUPU
MVCDHKSVLFTNRYHYHILHISSSEMITYTDIYLEQDILTELKIKESDDLDTPAGNSNTIRHALVFFYSGQVLAYPVHNAFITASLKNCFLQVLPHHVQDVFDVLLPLSSWSFSASRNHTFL